MNASALDVASQNLSLVGTVVSMLVPPPSTPEGVMEQAVAKGGPDQEVSAELESQWELNHQALQVRRLAAACSLKCTCCCCCFKSLCSPLN